MLNIETKGSIPWGKIADCLPPPSVVLADFLQRTVRDHGSRVGSAMMLVG